MRKIVSFFLFFQVFVANAQQLSIDEAVAIALEHNYGIQWAARRAEYATASNTAGAAGMLPTVAATATGTYGQSNVYQQLASGAENKYPAQDMKALSAGVELGWTIFNGGRMFIAKKRLAMADSLGQIGLRESVLQTTYLVVAAYYNMVRIGQQLRAADETIGFNRERLAIIETGFAAGNRPKNDVLQAKIDLNASLQNRTNQQVALDEARRSLNVLLGRSPLTACAVADSIPIAQLPAIEQLTQRADSLSTTLQAYQTQADIARLQLTENRRAYLPSLSLRAAYAYSNVAYSDANILKNRGFGPQVGATLSIPIFDAGTTARRVATAKIDLQSAELSLESARLSLAAELQSAWDSYQNQQQLLDMERNNNQLARENLRIVMERLRLGQTTTLEVQQANESLLQSTTRMINFSFNAKLAETELKRIAALF